MSHPQHSIGSRLGTRLALGLLALATCAGLAVTMSSPASAVSTTQLQYDLAGLGYLPFSGVDGQTGPQTQNATSAFQTDACIGVDGVDGPQTDAALGAKVSEVQGAAGAAQDGAFGPATKDAVAAWQSAHGLAADGAAGAPTMAAMGIARTACTPPDPGEMNTNIANIAAQELNNSGRNHEIGGYNCNFYSTALSVGGSACSNGWRTEEWCADFALWVWGQAGANTGGLNAAANSFYLYGVNHGTYHTSGPQVGDAVVFNVSSGTSHVGLVVAASGDSFTYISGNSTGSDGTTTWTTQKNLSVGSGGVSGFSSPVA